MTFHTKSKRPVRGSACPGGQDGCKSPRIAVSLDPDEFRRLAWWAAKRGKPIAWAVREAVHCYLVPMAPDADRDHEASQRPEKQP